MQEERTVGTVLQNEDGTKIPFTPTHLKKYNKILIYSHFKTEDKYQEVENLVDLLFQVGKYYPPRKIWCNVFVSEAHEVAGKMDKDNPLNRIATKGKRYGITLICDTQRPSQLSHTILTQSTNHIIFRLSQYEYPYFQEYKIPIEDFKEHIDKDFHFVLYDGKDYTLYKPISLSFYNKTKKRKKK